MMEFFRNLLEYERFTPQGSSMAWTPSLVWLHAISDAALALAYFVIPAALLLFVRKRRDLAYHTVFLMFGLFIFLCGTTRLVQVISIWIPMYWLEGGLKALTAVVSLATAAVLWPLIPKALALPSIETLREANAELENSIAESRKVQVDLERRRRELEAIIDERTQALRTINRQLLRENAERCQAEKELMGAREAAEQAGRAKTQFLANMSHELRTPLNAIIGFSEVLEDNTFGPLNERQTRYVRNILTSGKDLLQLINDVLDLSKIAAGRMDLDLEAFNPRDALSDIQKLVRALASGKEIEISVEAPEQLPPLVADRIKFKQILYNLLSNAVKFTPQRGSVRVCVEQVSAEDAGENAHAQGLALPLLKIAVIDTGIGIPPEAHDRIFLEFEQLDSSFQRMHEGSGLGLALTRKLVELHGGRIWLESEGLGKGCAFTFLLPLTPRIASPHGQAQVTPFRFSSPEDGDIAECLPPADDCLVVVAEDDRNARELLTHYLSTAGYRVAHASDGEEALRLARELHPTAVTLDVLLPRRSGWEVLRELKASPETASIPVIMVSITKDSHLAFSLGAADYLVKPVDRERLLASLRRATSGTGRGKMTVLIVDDEPAAVDILSASVRHEGHRVLAAYGGRHGIELALQHEPDVIVLDLNMPDVSGFDVVQRLREHPRVRKIPILVFTALDLGREERLRLGGQVSAVFSKTAPTDLIRALDSLRRSRQKQSIAAG